MHKRYFSTFAFALWTPAAGTSGWHTLLQAGTLQATPLPACKEDSPLAIQEPVKSSFVHTNRSIRLPSLFTLPSTLFLFSFFFWFSSVQVSLHQCGAAQWNCVMLVCPFLSSPPRSFSLYASVPTLPSRSLSKLLFVVVYCSCFISLSSFLLDLNSGVALEAHWKLKLQITPRLWRTLLDEWSLLW